VIVGYELGTSSAAAAAGAAYIEFRGNATRRVKIREIGAFSQTATAVSKGQLGRPAAAGITPTAPITWLPQDPADAAGTAQTAIAWGTAPTAPANGLRQFDFNNVPGSGVIFTWPADGELIVPAAGVQTLVLWNAGAAAGPALDAYFVGSE
jgi:hypothetical protein